MIRNKTNKMCSLNSNKKIPGKTNRNGREMEAWKGKCLAIIQSTSKKGSIKITAKSGTLPSAAVILRSE
jgi:hypothetical protein